MTTQETGEGHFYSRMQSIKQEYEVTLLGAGNVGKTALVNRISHGVFIDSYDPTIEDFYCHETTMDSIGTCIVDILDLAGQEQYTVMRRVYISASKCASFALFYSVDDRRSFEETVVIYQEILSVVTSPEDVRVILVGNKSDLEHKEVETSEGQLTAKNIINNCPFIETSAKDGTNVQKFYLKLIELSVQVQGLLQERQQRPSAIIKQHLQTLLS